MRNSYREPHRPASSPPQFRLKTIFIFTTFAAIVLAIVNALGVSASQLGTGLVIFAVLAVVLIGLVELARLAS
jgi:hypothetical protein